MLGVEPGKDVPEPDGLARTPSSKRRWSIGGVDRSRLSKSSFRWRSPRESRDRSTSEQATSVVILSNTQSNRNSDHGAVKLAPKRRPRSTSLRLPGRRPVDSDSNQSPLLSGSGLYLEKLERRSEPSTSPGQRARGKKRNVFKTMVSVAKTLSRFTKSPSLTDQSRRSSNMSSNSVSPSLKTGMVRRTPSLSVSEQPQQRRSTCSSAAPARYAPKIKRAPSLSITASQRNVELTEEDISTGSTSDVRTDSKFISTISQYDGDMSVSFLPGVGEIHQEKQHGLACRSISMEDIRVQPESGDCSSVKSADASTEKLAKRNRSNSMSYKRSDLLTLDTGLHVTKARAGSLANAAPSLMPLKLAGDARRQRKSFTTLLRKQRSRETVRPVEEDFESSETYKAMCTEFEQLLAPVRGNRNGLGMKVETDSPVNSPTSTRSHPTSKPLKPKRSPRSRSPCNDASSIGPSKDAMSPCSTKSASDMPAAGRSLSPSTSGHRLSASVSEASHGSLHSTGDDRMPSACKPAKPKRTSKSTVSVCAGSSSDLGSVTSSRMSVASITQAPANDSVASLKSGVIHRAGSSDDVFDHPTSSNASSIVDSIADVEERGIQFTSTLERSTGDLSLPNSQQSSALSSSSADPPIMLSPARPPGRAMLAGVKESPSQTELASSSPYTSDVGFSDNGEEDSTESTQAVTVNNTVQLEVAHDSSSSSSETGDPTPSSELHVEQDKHLLTPTHSVTDCTLQPLDRKPSIDSLDSDNIKWKDVQESPSKTTGTSIRRSANVNKQLKPQVESPGKKSGIIHQENLMRQWSTRRSKIKRHGVAHRIIESYERRETEVQKLAASVDVPEPLARMKSMLSIHGGAAAESDTGKSS
eukprot:scpid71020/ scgid19261/ 